MSNIELVLDSVANNSYSLITNQKKSNNDNNGGNISLIDYPPLRLSW